ncbi:MAG: bifunctional phosphoglucose/phosphomannose isomerase [Candidatus Rokubacteria bacterium]|nr:bifunctional phosphoglucose/phosphomannose isomerase [Candidatus Rokubacteria bacterium]
MTLDDVMAFERVDLHNARDVLAGFPKQCRQALGLEAEPALSIAPPRLVIVAGMGGSAASGDLLAACAADRLEVPILVHRGYGLPSVAVGGTLVIASSYSGETAEVRSAAEAALVRGLPLVAVTAGGGLGALARARGLPRVTLPAGLMPRMALGYLFFPVLGLLRSAGLRVAGDAEVAEALATVEALAAELAPERPAAANEAKRLALGIGRRLPVVYGGPDTAAIAYRWKTDFEENAKAFALAGSVPEVCHNEIEAWLPPSAGELHPVLLRDRDEPPEVARQFALLRELIGSAAGGLTESWSRGSGRLARLLSLVYLGQWASYYLAILRGMDPWSVPLLDELKRRMGRDGAVS